MTACSDAISACHQHVSSGHCDRLKSTPTRHVGTCMRIDASPRVDERNPASPTLPKFPGCLRRHQRVDGNSFRSCRQTTWGLSFLDRSIFISLGIFSCRCYTLPSNLSALFAVCCASNLAGAGLSYRYHCPPSIIDRRHMSASILHPAV
jgi:hypothetical protein